ncbi:MAG: hypothetical protein HC840_26485 [Leptolyngbyaceae cyanobacterium RM2_2_4]|nr:hypothetical protein [Synechococcaceae cyanobacterium SM2_3_2]NJO52353.1 hypothetical protein [Leptolyngbyaceae cyanobacterium RM2_2_4]
MAFILSSIMLALGLGAGMAASMEVGFRLGMRERQQDPNDSPEGNGAVDSTVFAILGLILAFTFTGALSRLDNRRELIAKEANAIGTAYLRLDLLSAETQAELRPIYRDYLSQRIDLANSVEQASVAEALFESTLALQNQIWQISTQAVLAEGNPALTSLVIAATNDLIDVTNERLQAFRMHPPSVVYYLMYILALAAALLIGFNMSGQNKRSYFHAVLFCSIISATIYITLELEDPRRGLLRISTGDRILVELLDSMDP